MENAHERRWPPGLQTLETRQMNRRWKSLSLHCCHLQTFSLVFVWFRIISLFSRIIKNCICSGNTSSTRHVGSLGSRRWWWWPATTPTSVTTWSSNLESWWSLPTASSSCDKNLCGSNQNLQWILDGFQNGIHNNQNTILANSWAGMSVEFDCWLFLKIWSKDCCIAVIHKHSIRMIFAHRTGWYVTKLSLDLKYSDYGDLSYDSDTRRQSHSKDLRRCRKRLKWSKLIFEVSLILRC